MALQIEEEEDVYWQRDSRESHSQIRERGRAFVRWLMSRPERRLAVVSHSSFLHFLLSCYGHGASEAVASEIRRWCAPAVCCSHAIERARASLQCCVLNTVLPLQSL